MHPREDRHLSTRRKLHRVVQYAKGAIVLILYPAQRQPIVHHDRMFSIFRKEKNWLRMFVAIASEPHLRWPESASDKKNQQQFLPGTLWTLAFSRVCSARSGKEP